MGRFRADVGLQILSFVAQSERENIKKRQAEGIAAARKRGIHLGRPTKELPGDFAAVVRQWEEKSISMEEVLRQCKVSQSTFYRRLKAYRATQK